MRLHTAGTKDNENHENNNNNNNQSTKNMINSWLLVEKEKKTASESARMPLRDSDKMIVNQECEIYYNHLTKLMVK